MIHLYVKIPERFVRLIFQNGFWVMHLPFVRMVKFQFLYNSQWTTFPIPSCLVLYTFCANLRHSFIMWLIISSNHHIIYICSYIASYIFLHIVTVAHIRRRTEHNGYHSRKWNRRPEFVEGHFVWWICYSPICSGMLLVFIYYFPHYLSLVYVWKRQTK